jgi:hypothetical protein
MISKKATAITWRDHFRRPLGYRTDPRYRIAPIQPWVNR